jgi:hypothetical protein
MISQNRDSQLQSNEYVHLSAAKEREEKENEALKLTVEEQKYKIEAL